MPESFPGLHAWLDTPFGRHVMAWEEARLEAIVADIFGYHAVQLGIPEHDFLRANRMPHRLHCGSLGEAVAVAADFDALPFAANSLDLVVLPHVLEFTAHPHQVLREVERVLVPEGQLVVSGFNPVSLFGLRRAFSRCDDIFPWKGQYLGVRRLKDWLQLLGFESQPAVFGCYQPVLAQQKWIERLDFLERAGPRWWPIVGGVYVVQAVKRVQGMRLIVPVWRDRRARARKLAPLAQKTSRPPESGGAHRNNEPRT